MNANIFTRRNLHSLSMTPLLSTSALLRRAVSAKGDIQKLFEEDIRKHPDRKGWSQFLDVDPDEKRGSYGTSAGVQVLVSGGYSLQAPGLAEATAYLEQIAATPTGTQRPEFLVVYKLAALADSMNPSAQELANPNKVMDALRARCSPDGGWSAVAGGWTISLLGTAVALNSLRRYAPFQSGDDCVKALTRLGELVLAEDSHTRISELALALLVLSSDWRRKNEVKNLSRAIASATERLENWSRRRKGEMLGIPEMFIFHSEGENRYLLLLPDCLTALALMSNGRFEENRSYVMRVIDFFSSPLLENTGFRSPVTARQSTVDHLWLHRLFVEAERRLKPLVDQSEPMQKKDLIYGLTLFLFIALALAWRYAGGTPFFGYVYASVLVVIGVIAATLTYRTKSRLSMAIFGGNSAIALGLLVNFLHDLSKGQP